MAVHCIPAEDEEGWRVVTDPADAAFVIDTDEAPGARDDDHPSQVTLVRFADGQMHHTLPWQIDYRPLRWRSGLWDRGRR